MFYILSEMNFFSNFLGNHCNPLKLNKLINEKITKKNKFLKNG